MKPTTPKPPPPLDAQGLPVGYRFREDWEITPRKVDAMVQNKEDFVLVDCRTPGEHEAARIEGAQLLPLQQIAEAIDELEDDRDKPIVVHCHHGGRSLQFTAVLRQQGFTDVKSMAGGIDLWSIDIDPAIPRY